MNSFPLAAITKAGYGAVWKGQKTWNGVAILREAGNLSYRATNFPGTSILIGCIYLPNGNAQPGPKLD